MQFPVHEVGPALQVHEWLQGSPIPLSTAAHPSGLLLALARGNVLCIAPVIEEKNASSAGSQLHCSGPTQQQALAPCHIHHTDQQYTALAWFVHLKQNSDPGNSLAQHLAAQRQCQEPKQWETQAAACTTKLAALQPFLDPDVLLSGTIDGHIQIHSTTGQLMFRQRLMASPVLDILVRPHCSGLCSSDASEEVCVTFKHAIVRINALDLRSQVRMLQLAQQGHHSAAATIQPLVHIRYEFPASVGPRVSGLSFGTVPTDLYSLLSSGSSTGGSQISSRQVGRQKVCIITVGQSPCLSAFEAEDHPNRSTLAALVGMASTVASGVAGVASRAAGLGPSMVAYGMKSIMKPISSWYTPSQQSSHSNTSSIHQPGVVSYDDVTQLPKPEPVSLTRQLRDGDRVLEGLVPAPIGGLLAAPDNLGRVMLLEGGSMTALRLWKGYRDAQCGWILPPPSHPASPLGLLLVLLAPKRQALEVWLPRAGQRLVSVAVDYPCLLVPVGLPCGGWGNDDAVSMWRDSCRSSTTLVLNMQSGQVWDAIDCLSEG